MAAVQANQKKVRKPASRTLRPGGFIRSHALYPPVIMSSPIVTQTRVADWREGRALRIRHGPPSHWNYASCWIRRVESCYGTTGIRTVLLLTPAVSKVTWVAPVTP